MALGGVLLGGAGARADYITYLAGGTFLGGTTPGTPTFTSAVDPNTTLTYTTTLSTATVPPANQVSFGTFTTASTSATPVALGGGFDLTILNTDTADSIVFHGNLSGSLTATSSLGANVLFSGPLTQTLDGFTFKILSADSGVAGRVNLGAPTTNGGVTTINGEVSVPEPSALALGGLGGLAVAAGRLASRRFRARAAA